MKKSKDIKLISLRNARDHFILNKVGNIFNIVWNISEIMDVNKIKDGLNIYILSKKESDDLAYEIQNIEDGKIIEFILFIRVKDVSIDCDFQKELKNTISIKIKELKKTISIKI